MNKTMTKQQSERLEKFIESGKVFKHYINLSGDLVIIANYGKSYYCRQFIGTRGGFKQTWIYKYIDNDNEPFLLIDKVIH